MSKKGIIIAIIVIAVIAGGVYYFTKVKNSSQTNGTAAAGGGDRQAQMAQFREDHKFTFQFSRLVTNVGKLDGETDTPLTQDQAKKILVQLEPLRTATSMTQDDAKDNIKVLQEILTSDQRNNIAKMKATTRRFNGPGGTPGAGGAGGGQGGQGGQGGGQGAGRQRQAPQMVQNFNPFNGSDRTVQRWDKYFTALKDRADGKPAVKLTPEQIKARAAGNGRGPGGGAGNTANPTGPAGVPGGGGPPPPPPGG